MAIKYQDSQAAAFSSPAAGAALRGGEEKSDPSQDGGYNFREVK